MKIVPDANIFISAMFWGGNPRRVSKRVIDGLDELFMTEEIIEEIKAVLGRPKFHVNASEIHYYVHSLEELGSKIVPGKRLQNGSRDKAGNKYIECGSACDADFIISGDIHLLELKQYGNVKIVTAREYLNTAR